MSNHDSIIGPAHRNDVHLIGRVSKPPIVKRLSADDTLVTFNLVVDRPPVALLRSRQRVDTIQCVAWTVRMRAIVASWQADDVVEITGALHRRFWQADGLPRNRYEVELAGGSLIHRPEESGDSSSDESDDSLSEQAHEEAGAGLRPE